MSKSRALTSRAHPWLRQQLTINTQYQPNVHPSSASDW